MTPAWPVLREQRENHQDQQDRPNSGLLSASKVQQPRRFCICSPARFCICTPACGSGKSQAHALCRAGTWCPKHCVCSLAHSVLLPKALPLLSAAHPLSQPTPPHQHTPCFYTSCTNQLKSLPGDQEDAEVKRKEESLLDSQPGTVLPSWQRGHGPAPLGTLHPHVNKTRAPLCAPQPWKESQRLAMLHERIPAGEGRG